MNKDEITKRLLNLMVDEWTDNPEDYLDTDPIDIDYAKTMMKDLAELEDDAELHDSERVVHLATPELVQEVFNCLVKARKHEARVSQLVSYFEDNEEFIAYAYTYMYECHPADNPDDIAPMDFLDEAFRDGAFFFDTNNREFSRAEILQIMGNSIDKFNGNDNYVAFYSDRMELVSTNNPKDIIDYEEFANLIFDNHDALVRFLNEVVEEDDMIHDIFNCKKEDIING